MVGRTVYSLREVARIAGAKRRSVQLWGDAGVLEPLPETDHAGSGTHRQFPRRELEIAGVVSSLARKGISIGKLRAFATLYRKIYTKEFRGVKWAKRAMRTMDAARAGEGANYMIYFDRGDDGGSMEFVKGGEGSQVSFKFPTDTDGAVVINLNNAWSRLGE